MNTRIEQRMAVIASTPGVQKFVDVIRSGNQIIFRASKFEANEGRKMVYFACALGALGLPFMAYHSLSNQQSGIVSASIIAVILIAIMLATLRRPLRQLEYFTVRIAEEQVEVPDYVYAPTNYKTLSIQQIQNLYCWCRRSGGDTEYSLRAMGPNDEVLLVIIDEGHTHGRLMEEAATLLGYLCDKSVWRRDEDGTVSSLTLSF